MIIGYKDLFKMIGISIVSFCAVFVCALFLNYDIDLQNVEALITNEMAMILYEALRNMSKVVSIVSGGCLLLTAVVLLCFYIGHYIDTHQKQLGILKALGYSRFSVAKGFAVFGMTVLVGTALGFLGASLLTPTFYSTQNEEGLLPDFDPVFHPALFAALVILPALFFAMLSVAYAYRRLKIPALALIRESAASTRQSKADIAGAKKQGAGKNARSHQGRAASESETGLPFLAALRKSNIRRSKSLIFFITFAVFCFSSMMQMSFSMDELSSAMMSVMMMSIGFVLACVTLFIATTSVVKANSKTITMMKVFGYRARDCAGAVLGGYRPWAYLGFVLGTIYQYVLLKLVLTIVFADVEILPDYRFDVPAMLITFAVFVLLYESVMRLYAKKMEHLSLKEIMLD